MTLHHGVLYSARVNDLSVEASEVRLEDYRRGTLANGGVLAQWVKSHLKKHRGRFKFIPPRVLFAGYFGNHQWQIALKHILVEADVRQVFMLQRAMAIALGHSAAETVPEKRTYLLFDQDIVQVFGVDGIEVAIDYSCEMEMDYFQDLRRGTVSMLGNNVMSSAAKERISEILSDMKERGFIESGVYVWGSSGENHIQQVLAGTNVDGIEIKRDYAIEGALHVLNNIKQFF